MNPKTLGHDVVFFKMPLCSKCREVEGHLKAIKDEHPEITIRELNMITNLGLARRHGVTTVPALLVGGKPLNGLIP
jgi:hypothetical protein